MPFAQHSEAFSCIQGDGGVLPLQQRRNRQRYRAPEMLVNVQVLDLLEISGSQKRAARALAMAQSTVSRCYQEIAEQLQLGPRLASDQVCRWGSSDSLRHLRLACRAHRLQHSTVRLATDALHQPLLERLPHVQRVPPRLLANGDWRTLLQEGVVDGVVVSSFGAGGDGGGMQKRWRGHLLQPLGSLESRPMAPAQQAMANADGRLLVPSAQCWPGLHQQLEAGGLVGEVAPRHCQGIGDWLALSQSSGLPVLVAEGIIPTQHWDALPLEPASPVANTRLVEELFLAWPDDTAMLERPAQSALRAIRRRVHRAGLVG